jgi:hypothetical protein
MGNYQVRPDGAVNLLDFGAIRVFPASFARGVIDLFEAIRDHDDEKAAHAYRNWGFDDITPTKVTVLNGWARFLYEPLLDDRVRRIQENEDGQYGRAVAEEVHTGLKSLGGRRRAPTEIDGSFCFFFQKEALACFILCIGSGSFLKKRTKKLS